MSLTKNDRKSLSEGEEEEQEVEFDERLDDRAPLKDCQGERTRTLSSTSVCGVILFVFVIFLGVFINSLHLSDRNASPSCEQAPVRSESVKPKYVLYNAHGRKDHLKHVEIVLQRFGYEETAFNESSSSDWTLMWAHDYPFNTLKKIDFKNLKPCQRVNHVPGCGFITNKVDLSTTRLKYVPRAFKLPKQKEELIEYSEQHPDKLFVHKHNQHRHIRVRRLEEIDMDDTNNFVQEFIGNPLLVDGYKFDIGVYTIITSVDPLRVHYYNGDILFRFCPVKYLPFDGANVDKYIVGDDYLPIWKVPSLSTSYNTMKHGMRDSFNLYIKSQGRDPQRIWDQIEESIRLMMYEKEKHLVDILRRYRGKRNFFELMRIDFVVDDDLNVFMMEANMSPNLSAAHFPPNQLLYEQVLYNSLKMAGLAFPQQNGSCTGSVHQMMASNKNIVVDGQACSNEPCINSCAPDACKLCYPCLSSAQKEILFDAVSEHTNRGDTKRVVPAPVDELEKLSQQEWDAMSSINQFMAQWFLAKCKADPSGWC